MTELYHYNHNHDPRTGKFTTSSGRYSWAKGRQMNKIYKSLTDDQKRNMFFGPSDSPVEKKLIDRDTHKYYKESQKSEYYRNSPDQVIIIKNAGRPVASAKISPVTKTTVVISDLMTRLDKQGQGYGDAAVKKGMEWFESSSYESIRWDAAPDNIASQKLAEKYGFQLVSGADQEDAWKQYEKRKK